MTNSKHEHHRSKAHVDLEKQRVYLGSETYRWEDIDDRYSRARYWSRISKTRCRKNLKEVPFVPEEKRNHERHDWDDALRPLDDHKRKDRHLLRKLKHAVAHEERAAAKRETKGETAKLEDVLAMEEAVDRIQHLGESQSESADDGEPRKKESKPIKGTAPISDRKHGVKLFSNNGKFFFRIAVYKSTKYEDCSSVYLTIAGKRYLYTLDKKNMKALREEVAKGVV
jgi:hypothetical protein